MSATNSNAPYIKGSSLLSYLRGIYPGREVITSTDFRAFLNISAATDQRMRAKGVYPRTISLPGVMRDPRIMLVDLAVWLEQGGCPEPEGRAGKKRGRGSEAWKKNHPPKATPAAEVAPKIPSEIIPETSSDTALGQSSEVAPEAVSETVSETSTEKLLETNPDPLPEPSPAAAPEAVAENRPDPAPQAQA